VLTFNSGVRVKGKGLRLGLWLEYRVQDLQLRVSGFGYRVYGIRLRV
jgi:hypothetical protein